MHNYSIPVGGTSGITQIRPGLLGVPTPPTAHGPSSVGSVSSGLPVVPYADEEDDDQDLEDAQDQEYDNVSRSGLSMSSPEKPRPMAVPFGQSNSSSNGYGSYRDVQHSAGFSFNSSISASVSAGGGWSMPNSDIRSGSVALSYSEVGSREGSRSDDEVLISDDEADGEASGDGGFVSIAGSAPGSTGSIPSPSRIGYSDGYTNGEYGSYSFAGRSGWKKEASEYTPSERAYGASEKDGNGVATQDQEWVGMDMDMDVSNSLSHIISLCSPRTPALNAQVLPDKCSRNKTQTELHSQSSSLHISWYGLSMHLRTRSEPSRATLHSTNSYSIFNYSSCNTSSSSLHDHHDSNVPFRFPSCFRCYFSLNLAFAEYLSGTTSPW